MLSSPVLMMSGNIDTSRSTNNDIIDNESSAIIGNRQSGTVFNRIGKMFTRTTRRPADRTPADGYVEFGTMTEQEQIQHSNRTLNTFAGTFAPVALSMFSALIFIRVGELIDAYCGNEGC